MFSMILTTTTWLVSDYHFIRINWIIWYCLFTI